MAKFYGINQVADRKYGAIAALTYWVFCCRDKKRSPAMGIKTWGYLESSIQNAAEPASTIEDYLEELKDRLVLKRETGLSPKILAVVLEAWEDAPVIMRVNPVTNEMSEIPSDQHLGKWGWRDLIEDVCMREGCFETDILHLARARPGIIQALCRLRYEEDNLTGKTVDEIIDIEAEEVASA